MFQENDNATRLQAQFDETAEGGGYSSLAETITGETPPVVVMQTLADGSADAPAPVPASPAPAPAPAPKPVSATNVGNKLAIGMTPTFMDRVKDGLGAAQTAVSSPFQSAGTKAAKALGADDPTAAQVGIWLLPVVIVLAVAGTVFALRRRIFSHHITA